MLLASMNTPTSTRVTIWALLCIAVIFTGIYAYDLAYNSAIVSFAATPPPALHPEDSAAPHHISIADVGIDMDIEPGVINNGIWSVSEFHANHLKTSAHPGTKGNVIIYGHDKPSIFERLRDIEPGASITISTTSGEHVYIVEETYTTAPTDSSPILPTDEETLTVYTCEGLFNEKRFIIRAKPA